MSSNNKTITTKIVWIIVLMIIITFFSPIIYDVFCKFTGANGYTMTSQTQTDHNSNNASLPLGDANKVPNTNPYEATLNFINSTPSSHYPQYNITVELDANVDKDLPWEFTPLSKYVVTSPGKAFLVYFRVKNKSDTPHIGTAIYNVSPVQSGQYFVKIQCFCFENILLAAQQELILPVLFKIEEDIVDNKDTSGIRRITLSYTFFKSLAT